MPCRHEALDGRPRITGGIGPNEEFHDGEELRLLAPDSVGVAENPNAQSAQSPVAGRRNHAAIGQRE
jgi:hypothetical protein